MDADAYLDSLRRAEFFLATLWASERTVRAFAGDVVERAMFDSEVDRHLVARDPHVTHYAVVRGDAA